MAAVLLLAVLAMPAAADAKVVWLCKPGQRANPCEPSLTTTTFSPTGKRLGVERVQRAKRRRADCFYVYPTVSDQQRPQATQVVDDVLRSIALYQTARYSRDCRVFAPVYRQVTIQGLLNPDTVTPEMHEQGYDDVVEAWRAYLKRFNHGRGVVLIGHSQGTYVLRRLVREEIDPKASERRRLVSAVLLGGNVSVRAGADRGGDFKRVRACRRASQTGCVIAYSTFNAPVPENALFGRANEPGRQILCTNPAALGGGSAKLTPIYPSAPFAPSVIGAAANAALAGLPRPSTPWAAFPGAYSGRCSTAGGASVLQVKPLRGAFTLTAVPDATWGLHLTDANIALGQLANLVRRQIKASRLGSRPHSFVYGVATRLDDWPIQPTFWTWPTISVHIAKTWSTWTASRALPGATHAASRSACTTCSPSGPPSRLTRPSPRRTCPPHSRRDVTRPAAARAHCVPLRQWRPPRAVLRPARGWPGPRRAR